MRPTITAAEVVSILLIFGGAGLALAVDFAGPWYGAGVVAAWVGLAILIFRGRWRSES